jgi:hypothetical protein
MGHAFSATGAVTGYTGSTVAVNQNYVYTEDEIRTCENRLRRAAAIVRTRIRAGMSDIEKIITVAEYVVRNCDYEIDFVKNQNAAAAICYHKAQCSGYSRAITYLLDKLGIWSIVVDGNASDGLGGGGSHAWNIVRVGGHYYHLDVTFMEAYNIGRVMTNAAHSYLFYDDKLMSKDHEWDRDFFPPCTDPTKALKENRIARATDAPENPKLGGVHDSAHEKKNTREFAKADLGVHGIRKSQGNTEPNRSGGAVTLNGKFGSEEDLKNTIREALRQRKRELEFTLDLTKLDSAVRARIVRACFDEAWAGMNVTVRVQITQIGADRFKMTMIYG